MVMNFNYSCISNMFSRHSPKYFTPNFLGSLQCISDGLDVNALNLIHRCRSVDDLAVTRAWDWPDICHVCLTRSFKSSCDGGSGLGFNYEWGICWCHSAGLTGNWVYRRVTWVPGTPATTGSSCYDNAASDGKLYCRFDNFDWIF